MAPVNISVAVLARATGVMPGVMAWAMPASLSDASVAGRRSGMAMSCAARSSLNSPAASPETPSPDVETFAALSLPDRLVSASPVEGANPAISMAAAGSSDLPS